MDAKFRKVLEAWDAEIETDESELLDLRKQAFAEQRKLRASEQSELAPPSAKLLKAAGITEADARKQADESFERARKTATGARKRALGVLQQRIRANDAEVQRLLAVKRDA
jgi:hypothetical protein